MEKVGKDHLGRAMLTPWYPPLRLHVAGLLLVGILACAGEVAEESVSIEQRDTAALTLGGGRGATVASDRVLAEQRDAGAQARLAEAYYLGDGVAQDFEEALRWARLAADQGNALGQGVLASAYNTGRGVAQDYGEALRWARLAADQGNALGQTVLGFLYRNGYGVAQDYGEALRWTRLAAEQGNAGGQILLGMMYMSDPVVEQDYISAYMWLTLGMSSSGVTGVRGMLDGLAKRMTSEQIAEAEARVRNWRK